MVVERLYDLSIQVACAFNSGTIIRFRVGTGGFVSLKVFDVLGRKVATLVNENLPAGNYERMFNVTDLAGGVYFYQIVADGFDKTKRLLLLR